MSVQSAHFTNLPFLFLLSPTSVIQICQDLEHAIEQKDYSVLLGFLEKGIKLDFRLENHTTTFGQKLFPLTMLSRTLPKNRFFSSEVQIELKKKFWERWNNEGSAFVINKDLLWDLAIQNNDTTIRIPLIEKGVISSGLKSIEEQTFVAAGFQAILEKPDLAALRQLISSHAIPFIHLVGERLPIVLALDTVDKNLRLEIEREYRLTKNLIENLMILDSLSKSFMLNDDLGIKMILKSQISVKIEEIRQQGLVEIIQYKNGMQVHFELLRSRIDDARKTISLIESRQEETFVLNYRDPKYQNQMNKIIILKDAESLCVCENKYSLLSRLQARHRVIGKEGVNYSKSFMLDKIIRTVKGRFCKELPYESDVQVHSVLILSQVLTDIASKEKKFESKFFQGLIKGLGLCGRWDVEALSASNIFFEITKALSEASIDFPLLVPTGFKGHSTILGIEKQENGSFRVTLYNTGAGVYKHAQWKDSNYYQTSLIFENVPLQNLQNEKVWIKLLERDQLLTQEELYLGFYELVCEGVKVDASLDSFDYEQIQVHGTCTAQSLMAFVREYVMRIHQGSYQAKIGAYKYLKATIYQRIGSRNLDKVDIAISGFVDQKLNKSVGLITLMKVVENQGVFDFFYTNFHQWLKKHDMQAFQHFRQLPITNSFEKFYFLKMAALRIAKQRISDFRFEQMADPAMIEIIKMTEFMFEEIFQIKKQIYRLLNDNFKMGDLKSLSKNVIDFVFCSYRSDAVFCWICEYFKAQDERLLTSCFEALIGKINTFEQELKDRYISFFYKRLEKTGRDDLVATFQKLI